MSIEDIDYLKKNSIKQSYNFLVDSQSRDKKLYPEPNNYVITFDQPFKNVIGIEVSDYSIPRSMYSIDNYNNTLVICFTSTNVANGNISQSDMDNIINNGFDSYEDYLNHKNLFITINIDIGDYTITNFVPYFNNFAINNNYDIQINTVTNSPEITNLLYFTSNEPFIIDMNLSTVSETFGFDKLIEKNNNLYNYFSKYNSDLRLMKLYHSLPPPTSEKKPGINTDKAITENYIIAPGTFYFIGEKYIILRCPEIEEHLYRSLSYSKYNLGIAKFRVNSSGYNDTSYSSYNNSKLREFHPIGKLSKLSLTFQTPNNLLYDFRGVNHYIIFTIYYYEAQLQITDSFNPILNPNYKQNYNEYLYTNDEQEDENEDDEEELSKDNLNNYKKIEAKYSYST